MWFIQALRTGFRENVPEEVFEMSCSWFLSAVARGGAGGARAPPVFCLKSKNRPV